MQEDVQGLVGLIDEEGVQYADVPVLGWDINIEPQGPEGGGYKGDAAIEALVNDPFFRHQVLKNVTDVSVSANDPVATLQRTLGAIGNSTATAVQAIASTTAEKLGQGVQAVSQSVGSGLGNIIQPALLPLLLLGGIALVILIKTR